MRDAEGNLFLVAGAGTGKTHAIVAKIHHILSIQPQAKILAISFTNKAARDLTIRVKRRVSALRVQSGTFHGVALDLRVNLAFGMILW